MEAMQTALQLQGCASAAEGLLAVFAGHVFQLAFQACLISLPCISEIESVLCCMCIPVALV